MTLSAWWRAMLQVWPYRCVCCGDEWHVEMDHVWPRGQGGPNAVANGLPLCGAFSRTTRGGCHRLKTDGRLRVDPRWLGEGQREFLARAGWVAWDVDGRPYGRGWKHFEKE